MDTEYIDMDRSDMRAATVKVYEGSSTKCCCGCAGNYYYADGTVYMHRGGGETTNDQEQADTKIDEIVGKVFRNLHRDDVDLTTYTYKDGDQMIAVTMGRKVYILNTAV